MQIWIMDALQHVMYGQNSSVGDLRRRARVGVGVGENVCVVHLLVLAACSPSQSLPSSVSQPPCAHHPIPWFPSPLLPPPPPQG